jgi:hypothetical protein
MSRVNGLDGKAVNADMPSSVMFRRVSVVAAMVDIQYLQGNVSSK